MSNMFEWIFMSEALVALATLLALEIVLGIDNIFFITIQAGSDGREDFDTVLFTANLLDYTVDDKSGALVSGSMTDPV